MRPFIKICGLRESSHARLAYELGAAALGFVHFPRSPRHLSLPQFTALAAALPATATKVLVCVDLELDAIQAFIAAGATAIQLHGRETPDFARHITGAQVWRGARLADTADLERELAFPCQRFILDAPPRPGESLPGGTGHRADWSLAASFVRSSSVPCLLAGGISLENADAALAAVQPAGLDLSSALESSPGCKDEALIRAFLTRFPQA